MRRQLHAVHAPALIPTGREPLLGVAAALFTALLSFAGIHKFGSAGAILPLIVVLGVILLLRPVVALSLVVTLTIVCEGPTFGIFTFTSNLYNQVYKDISLLDLLVGLAVVSVALDLVRKRRRLYVPRPLAVPLLLLALAMLAGVVVGHASGTSLRFAVASEDVLAYLLLLPIAVVNLDIDRRQVNRLLGAAMALAIAKSVLGLIEIFGNLGQEVEGARLTYYEPTANWLIMIAVLTVCAAVLARVKPPRWMLLGFPLLAGCLLLSYRRSFWIGAALGLLLVLLLASTPTGRRMLVPAALGVGLAIWLLGSLNFQSQLPVVKRISSLSPAKLEANKEDRYRLDERANVLGEISAHPFTGLGVGVPWAATVRPLSVEHEEGRQYVHFAALWFWIKLGILGLFAYLGILAGSGWVAWQAWRRSREPLLRGFALASLAGMAGLLAIDTTASFTGVDARFTVLFATQVGLLALLVRTSEVDPETGFRQRQP